MPKTLIPPLQEELDPAAEGVIGAGFGRTGTNSLMFALDEIGMGPTMHMLRLLDGPESFFIRIKRLVAFANAGVEKDKRKRQEYLRVAMHGHKSELDFPASIFYKDFMEMYPNKKVVLTVRGSADEWYTSVSSTIFKIIFPDLRTDPGLWLFAKATPPGIFLSSFMEKTVKQIFPKQDAVGFKSTYDEWIAEVKRSVPKERLLIFDVKQGWEPLTTFLKVPAPKTPFPRTNDAAEINAEFQAMRAAGFFFLFLYVLLAFLVGRRCVRRVTRNKSKHE